MVVVLEMDALAAKPAMVAGAMFKVNVRAENIMRNCSGEERFVLFFLCKSGV